MKIRSNRQTTSKMGGTSLPRNEGGDSVGHVTKPWNVRMSAPVKNASPEILGKTKHRQGKI